VFVDSGCVDRNANTGLCEVSFGYYNPNRASQSLYLPAGPTNQFQPSQLVPLVNNTTAISPPVAFFPQRVRGAMVLRYLCPTGSERLQWNLTTAGVSSIAEAAGPYCS
jgi:hypothetical protein